MDNVHVLYKPPGGESSGLKITNNWDELKEVVEVIWDPHIIAFFDEKHSLGNTFYENNNPLWDYKTLFEVKERLRDYLSEIGTPCLYVPDNYVITTIKFYSKATEWIIRIHRIENLETPKKWHHLKIV